MPRIKQIMQFGTGEEALFEDEIGRSVARFFFLLWCGPLYINPLKAVVKLVK